MDSRTTITLTFCECGENHIGNQMVGKQINHGMSATQVQRLAQSFEDSELIDLSSLLDDATGCEEACVLVIRGGVDKLIDESASLLPTLLDLDWDKRVYSIRHRKVVRKHARSNLIFAQHSQQPCYEQGKGTVIAYSQIPLLENLRNRINELFIQQCFDEPIELIAEGNLYKDNMKQGIGWHGDAERKIVIGVRLGGSMRLKFAWFFRCLPASRSHEIVLNHGDIYIMSSKAVGSDWSKRSQYTVRHCAGGDVYTKDK